MKKYTCMTFWFLFALYGCIAQPDQTQKIVPSSTTIPYPTISSNLNCEVFLEPIWGEDTTNWGKPTNGLAELYFDFDSNIYYFDYPNHRILKYDGQNTSPTQVIPLSEKYFFFGPSSYPPRPLTITRGRIYIPYATDRLAVLSMGGEEILDIRLPATFAILSPARNFIIIDNQEGLFFNGDSHSLGLTYYKKENWEKEVWDEVVTQKYKLVKEPFIWQDYFIHGAPQTILPEEKGGSHNAEDLQMDFLVSLHKISPNKDFLQETPVSITLEGTGTEAFFYSIENIDKEGWVYISMGAIDPTKIIRYSLNTNKSQIGVLPNEYLRENHQIDVASNGALYWIEYDQDDLTISPKIIRCHFPEDK